MRTSNGKTCKYREKGTRYLEVGVRVPGKGSQSVWKRNSECLKKAECLEMGVKRKDKKRITMLKKWVRVSLVRAKHRDSQPSTESGQICVGIRLLRKLQK